MFDDAVDNVNSLDKVMLLRGSCLSYGYTRLIMIIIFRAKVFFDIPWLTFCQLMAKTDLYFYVSIFLSLICLLVYFFIY